MKFTLLFAAVLAAVAVMPSDASGGEGLVYSVIYPGWGQVRTGQYGRGIMFAGAELVSLLGLFVSDIQYSRVVEDYDSARSAYLTADYIGDADYYYARMNDKWDDAERLNGYRNAFLGAAIGIWIINIIDMAIGDGDDSPALSMSVSGGTVRVSKGFAF
jgi:hypothetical protein